MIRYPSYQLYNIIGDCYFRGQPVSLFSAGSEIKLSSNSGTLARVMTINLETRRAWRGDKGGSQSIVGTFYNRVMQRRSSGSEEQVYFT